MPDHRWKRLARILLLTATLGIPLDALASVSVPLPERAAAQVEGLHLLGAGHLNWLFFSVYDAALYVTGSGYSPERPFALAIRYERNFSAAELARTSLKEMLKLNPGMRTQEARWAQDLERAFPSVKSGDVLVGLCVPGRYTEFFFNGKVYSRIDDPSFGPAFFSIWLSPKTPVPELRKALLGES
ncbi:MAG: chalcone isomerase family protein [Acidithiobacillus sp.]|uniref:chalcone isomerase family protein n=1 Tax=Acidithiobacillus sp. TaxID=1872118 RepID=UPI003D05F89E